MRALVGSGAGAGADSTPGISANGHGEPMRARTYICFFLFALLTLAASSGLVLLMMRLAVVLTIAQAPHYTAP
jgi:hypothetical protein